MSLLTGREQTGHVLLEKTTTQNSGMGGFDLLHELPYERVAEEHRALPHAVDRWHRLSTWFARRACDLRRLPGGAATARGTNTSVAVGGADGEAKG